MDLRRLAAFWGVGYSAGVDEEDGGGGVGGEFAQEWPERGCSSHGEASDDGWAWEHLDLRVDETGVGLDGGGVGWRNGVGAEAGEIRGDGVDAGGLEEAGLGLPHGGIEGEAVDEEERGHGPMITRGRVVVSAAKCLILAW